jgi:hypothetical protein
MGQAVSAAAHGAKAEARAAGEKVGPAVSAAVHEAQQSFRDREPGAHNGSTPGAGRTDRTGARGTTVATGSGDRPTRQ